MRTQRSNIPKYFTKMIYSPSIVPHVRVKEVKTKEESTTLYPKSPSVRGIFASLPAHLLI